MLALGCAAVHAGPDQSVDAIERASGAGDYATALQLSAEHLGRTRGANAARIGALQARLDVLIDAGEWSRQGAALREAIAQVPDAGVRAALDLCFTAGEAVNASNFTALFDVSQNGLAQGYRL